MRMTAMEKLVWAASFVDGMRMLREDQRSVLPHNRRSVADMAREARDHADYDVDALRAGGRS